MSMKSPLVPERRTDKNGVTSTRWVKADTDTSTVTSAIPAPAPVAAEESVRADPETIEQAALTYVNQVTDHDDGDEVFDSTVETAIEDFGTYPAVVVEEIARPASYVYQKMWGLKNMIDFDKSLESIRDHLNLSDFIIDEGFEDEADPENTVYNFGPAYEGLEPVIPEAAYPERRRQQLQGIISATSLILDLIVDGNADDHALGKSDDGALVISDENLRDLFINRPEDSGVVLEFMKERKTADHNRIMEMLNSKTPAIASGAL